MYVKFSMCIVINGWQCIFIMRFTRDLPFGLYTVVVGEGTSEHCVKCCQPDQITDLHRTLRHRFLCDIALGKCNSISASCKTRIAERAMDKRFFHVPYYLDTSVYSEIRGNYVRMNFSTLVHLNRSSPKP